LVKIFTHLMTMRRYTITRSGGSAYLQNNTYTVTVYCVYCTYKFPDLVKN